MTDVINNNNTVVETVEIPDQTASLTTSKRSIDDVAGEEELLTDSECFPRRFTFSDCDVVDSKRLKSEEV